MKMCETCIHSFTIQDRDDSVQCCAYPPTPMLVPTVQSGLDSNNQIVQRQVVVIQAHWPIVGKQQYCGCWKAKKTEVLQ
jgi:hypothetical protein